MEGWDRYRDARVTRRTTVGELWEALDVRDGTPVRLWRVLRFGQFHADFRRAIEALLEFWRCLPPSMFLRPVGTFSEGKDLWVVFEGQALRSLDQFFTQVPVFPWPIACVVLERVLRALEEFYHRMDDRALPTAAHGRLGLSTIFLDEEGYVRLAPPTVVPAYGSAYGFLVPWETEALGPMRTPDDGAPLSRLGDTYGLGVTGYFLLTGRWPWVIDESGQPVWTLREPLHAAAPWLPPEFDAWIRALLEPSRLDRMALAQALHRLYRQAFPESETTHLQRFFRDPQGYYVGYRRHLEGRIKAWRFHALREGDEAAALWFHEVLQRFDPWVARHLAQETWLEESRRRVVRALQAALPGLDAPRRPGPPASGLDLWEKPGLAFALWQSAMESALAEGRLLDAWTAWRRLDWNRAPAIGPSVEFLQGLDARLRTVVTRVTSLPAPLEAETGQTPRRSTRPRASRLRPWVATGLIGLAVVYGGTRILYSPASPPAATLSEAPSTDLPVPAVPPTCSLTPRQVRELQRRAEAAEARGDWIQACDARIQVLTCVPTDHPEYPDAQTRAEAACQKARESSTPGPAS